MRTSGQRNADEIRDPVIQERGMTVSELGTRNDWHGSACSVDGDVRVNLDIRHDRGTRLMRLRRLRLGGGQ